MIKKPVKKPIAKVVKKSSKKAYVPSDKEKYMCTKHKDFFTGELLRWKKEIIKANTLTNILNSSDDNVSSADMVDQASSYTDKTVEMKALTRSRKLIEKIDSALRRIKDDTYGHCEETSEPIGLKRLIARPIATLSIEAQERHERDEKIYIDD
jgi:DnaK suppressor protein